ncbi:MAG: hypothetical protein JOZ65_01665 [Chloroflexi bacterium]|nr:hypothetical protein [Chloroflexota bacterium]
MTTAPGTEPATPAVAPGAGALAAGAVGFGAETTVVEAGVAAAAGVAAGAGGAVGATVGAGAGALHAASNGTPIEPITSLLSTVRLETRPINSLLRLDALAAFPGAICIAKFGRLRFVRLTGLSAELRVGRTPIMAQSYTTP